jgi:hypothetical protein
MSYIERFISGLGTLKGLSEFNCGTRNFLTNVAKKKKIPIALERDLFIYKLLIRPKQNYVNVRETVLENNRLILTT